jgi:hypothetical protein
MRMDAGIVGHKPGTGQGVEAAVFWDTRRRGGA